MSYVVINAITVPQEGREELEARFANRAGEVSKAPGFESFSLLRPSDDGDRYLVFTRWNDRASFEAWMSSSAFSRGHKGPAGGGSEGAPRPVATGNEVWQFEVVQQEDAARGAASDGPQT